MTFAELKRRVLLQVFPDGQPENLRDQIVDGVTTPGIHTAFFNEALYDLQKYVPCYQHNNTDVLEHCATYFRCGYTVLPAPRGHIIRLSVLDRVSADEDAATPLTKAKVIDPAAHLDVSPDTIGGTTTEAYKVYPAEGTSVTIAAATFGTGTPFSMSVVARIYPDDGSADPVESTFTCTDDKLTLDSTVLLSNASADSYTVEITVTLTGMTGSQYQWQQSDRYVNVTISYEKLAGETASEPDWCSEIEYQQVDYANLLAYSRLCEKCSGSDCIEFCDSVVSAFFGTYRIKHRYPAPTDENLQGYPALPQGFHYPQSATDAGGRSPGGVWALYRGRIYIAPWIESTETVVIEWNGLKRQWSDADIVDDDPKFVQAVRLHFTMQHVFSFDNDPARYQNFKDQFYGNPGNAVPGALPELINECREETRIRRAIEAGVSGSANAAIGMQGMATAIGGGGRGEFYNEQQSYTANCPTGKVGDPVTAVIAAGEVSSAISVADANAKAMQLAQDRAASQLDCDAIAPRFYNTQQQYTARCAAMDGETPAADGNPVTVVIPAGHLWRYSQAAADAAALAEATEQAIAGLAGKCTYWNAPQTAVVSCPTGTAGADVTRMVSAHTFSSTKSQADANQLAYNEAVRLATEALSCVGDIVLYYNTYFKSAPAQHSCWRSSQSIENPFGLNQNYTLRVRCIMYPGAVSKAFAASYDAALAQNSVNFTAQNLAQEYAAQYAQDHCFDFPFPPGVYSTEIEVTYPGSP